MFEHALGMLLIAAICFAEYICTYSPPPTGPGDPNA